MTFSMIARAILLGLLFLAASNSSAATPVSIQVLRPNRVYPSKTSCDLAKVDFRNFTYFESEWMGASDKTSPEDPVRVVHGKYSFRDTGGFEDIFVEAVAHPDLESAAVSLLHSYGGGSSNQELVVMTFRCVAGSLTNTQLIHGDGHGGGAGVIFADGGKKMTMNSVYDYANGHCCPRYLETTVFTFTKRGYVLVATYQKENRQPR